MDPPGKRSGCTTKESVVKASRSPPGSDSVAASASGIRSSPANASSEHRVDEGGRRLAAGPVGHRHQLVGQSGRSPPVGLDAVEDPRLAVAHGQPSVPPTFLAEALLHRPPQRKARGGLRLLDPVDAVGIDHQAVLHVRRLGHLAARVPGDADGQHAPLSTFGERGEDVA